MRLPVQLQRAAIFKLSPIMPKIADIEKTPNPNAMKFVLREPLTQGVVRSYEGAQQAAGDPLATALFNIPHVTNIFYVDRWLTVTQDGIAHWDELLKQLAIPIREASASETQALAPGVPTTAPQAGLSVEDTLRLAQINLLLDDKVRPALLADGGGIEVLSLEGNRLTIRYHGACGTCPSSTMVTLNAIENLLHTVEPDLEVVAV